MHIYSYNAAVRRSRHVYTHGQARQWYQRCRQLIACSHLQRCHVCDHSPGTVFKVASVINCQFTATLPCLQSLVAAAERPIVTAAVTLAVAAVLASPSACIEPFSVVQHWAKWSVGRVELVCCWTVTCQHLCQVRVRPHPPELMDLIATTITSRTTATCGNGTGRLPTVPAVYWQG